MFCSKCGKEVLDDAVVCLNCGCAIKKSTTTVIEEDEIHIGFCVLSFFIPIFGIIYWALKYKEVPKKAKACGITAIASIAIYLVVVVISILTSIWYYI